MSRICFGTLLCALAVLLAESGCAPERRGRPDTIVLIVVDTLRRDQIGHWGGPASTPHIDGLAQRGVAIEAQASFHQTTMSMGALFTGRVPSLESGEVAEPLAWEPATWCGMARFMEESAKGRCLPASLPTLGETLRGAGYYGVGVVANSLLFRPAGFHRGFESWHEVGAARGGRRPGLRARSRTWEHVHPALEAGLDTVPEGRKLFLYVHYTDVHDYLLLGISYAEAVARMDQGIGDLLRILGERGRLAEAAVVLTSDHGEALGEPHVVRGMPKHGGNPSWSTVLDVPLIAVGFDPERIAALPRTQDVYGLLAGLAGMPVEAEDTLGEDELLVTERVYRTYRKGRFKSVWARHDDSVLVIDLEADPGETRDVAGEHADVVSEHRARIDALSTRLAPARPLETQPVPEYMLERLRELGYLE